MFIGCDVVITDSTAVDYGECSLKKVVLFRVKYLEDSSSVLSL